MARNRNKTADQKLPEPKPVTVNILDTTGKVEVSKEPIKQFPDIAFEVPAESIELSAEIAGAIFQAATNTTGYFNTTGSEHATKVTDGVVRVELPDPEFVRKTVEVVVPETLSFFLREV